MNLTSIVRNFGKTVSDNSPAILTALGVTGALTTAVLTGRASFNASRILAEEDLAARLAGPDGANGLETREQFELVWKLYIPAVASGIVTVTCIIAANRIGTRRAAALATAYAISEKAFDQYKDKVIEKFGEKKEQTVRDEIAQEKIAANPQGDKQVIIASGDVLCYDCYSGRYFTSNMEAIRKAKNDINERVLHDSYCSLSEFYERVGLSKTSVSDEVGWNSTKLMELDISTTLSDDGKPCMTVDFKVKPVRYY